MDSGNSGSLQSSSGGDDDFDSRCSGGGGGGGVVDSSPLSALLRQSAATGPPSVADFGGSFYGLQELATPGLPPLSQAMNHWPAALPAGDEASPSSSSHGVPACAEQPAPVQPPAPTPSRGSRKRTRASRRAPTTVLTTDTSNFRAMVQEFTGIPSPPFVGGAAASTRSRFDHLFTSPSSLRSAAAGATAASLPPYLLRPFAQKLHHPSPFPPFATPSTSSPAMSTIAITPSATTSSSHGTTAVASADGYHQLASAPAPVPSALFGMQDHGGSYLSFQNPLGTQLGGAATKYPTQTPVFDGGASPGGLSPSAPPRLHDPADFLGLTHGVMGGSDGTHLHHPRNRDHAGDELSGLVGAASVAGSVGPGGCKASYPSTAVSVRATPLLERNVESTPAGAAATTTTTAAAAMRTQGLDSWACISE